MSNLTLLSNAFAPTTYRWGFLRTDHAALTDALLAWRKESGSEHEMRRGTGELFAPLSFLDPLTMPLTREAIVQTDSEWTAYFDNSILGGDPDPAIGCLAQRIGCEGFTVLCHPGIAAPRTPGGMGFTLYSPQPTEWLNISRAVLALDERNEKPEYSFAVQGDPLPFEDTASYENPNIAERLTPELIDDYAHALGIRLFQNSFYGGRYAVFVEKTAWSAKIRSVERKRYRKRLGLE